MKTLKEHHKDNSHIYNIDNMIYMQNIEDKFFDLAIVDPPYGINASLGVGRSSKKKFAKQNKHWDKKTPNEQYFKELFRVSKNQIICGANYFNEYLYSTKSFICWIKNNPAPNFAQAEYLWTSFNINGKVYDSNKRIQHQLYLEGGTIHPTQKPIALYRWLLHKYAKLGDKIFDSHLGSGTNRIACYLEGFEFYGTELDSDYFNQSIKLFEDKTSQLKLDLIYL
jgi:site-specific DNA-methyltransferase (adenine-specific)